VSVAGVQGEMGIEAVDELMQGLGRKAVDAARVLALASTAAKNAALEAAARALRADRAVILAANAHDVAAARAAGMSEPLLDRLNLTDAGVDAMARALEDIARLPDPIGVVAEEWQRPNGLAISRVVVPLGVIGMIYESRPNVTADAGGLCLKSGNAVILRGGSEGLQSNRAIHACLVAGLAAAGLPEAAVQLVPTRDRAAVGCMLSGMTEYLDVLVPRGGRSLVARVQAEARVPVIGHLEGNCHVYIHAAADLSMARAIVLNSKLRRTGVCGAAETLLLDGAARQTHLAPIVLDLIAAGCEVRGDAEVQKIDARVRPASEADWYREYLDAIIAVRVVEGIDAAMAHIRKYGSAHTECIVTGDALAAQRFLAEVDSAIVLHNASTQFADGGEFGMGAEIGISTARFHARGPVGVAQLTSYKYVVRGAGQLRP
jgi:glutamate-5-semialdehyde dehydrogenase